MILLPLLWDSERNKDPKLSHKIIILKIKIKLKLNVKPNCIEHH